MIERNPQAMTMAFKKTQGKLLKIKELGITPDIDADSLELLIESLTEAKTTAEPTTTFAENVKGQRWYAENLVKFSGLGGPDATDEERTQLQFDAEYEDSFADTASESEMMDALRKIAA